MGGTSLGQIINIILAPVITRIYSPGLFGEYAVFLAIVNIIVITSSLKYEQAVFLPDEDEKAFNILILALLFVVAISALVFVLSLSIDLIAGESSFLKQYHWIALIPLLVLIQGIYYCIRNWISRHGNYRLISMGMIVRATIANIGFIVLGYYHYLAIGLIVGTILGQLAETSVILIIILKKDRNLIYSVKFKEMRSLFHRYKDFPKYALSSELINTLSVQSPIVILTSFFSPAIAGNYSLVQRVMGLPTKLISRSTQEVFKKKTANERIKYGKFDATYIKTFFLLLGIGIIPAIFFWFFLPGLFPIIFGKEWIEAGVYAKYLSIMFLFQFSVSPLGFSLYIAEKQNYELYWQVLLLIITSAALLSGIYLHRPDLAILFFSIAYSIMYILYFYWGWKFSKTNQSS